MKQAQIKPVTMNYVDYVSVLQDLADNGKEGTAEWAKEELKRIARNNSESNS